MKGTAGRERQPDGSIGSPNHDRVLAAMQPGEWLAVADILARSGLTRGNVGNVVSALYVRGRLQRRRDDGPGRPNRWEYSLTEA